LAGCALLVRENIKIEYSKSHWHSSYESADKALGFDVLFQTQTWTNVYEGG